jgi:hypothetical protein
MLFRIAAIVVMPVTSLRAMFLVSRRTGERIAEVRQKVDELRSELGTVSRA